MKYTIYKQFTESLCHDPQTQKHLRDYLKRHGIDSFVNEHRIVEGSLDDIMITVSFNPSWFVTPGRVKTEMLGTIKTTHSDSGSQKKANDALILLAEYIPKNLQ